MKQKIQADDAVCFFMMYNKEVIAVTPHKMTKGTEL